MKAEHLLLTMKTSRGYSWTVSMALSRTKGEITSFIKLTLRLPEFAPCALRVCRD